MIFKYPIILFLLVPITIIFWVYRNEKNIHTLRFPKALKMKSLASNKATRLLNVVNWLEKLVIILLVLTIAQPQILTSNQQTIKQGIDIVAILDTSKSMTAEDFKPNDRMSVAKDTLKSFVKKRKNDRIGLVAFGSDAITKAPITYDHSIINFHIDQTKVGEAGDGTAIGLAIATGITRLSKSNAKSKVMILITDGVNNAGQIDPISAANIAKSKGIKIYGVGIGDKKGAPIPIHHPTYGKRYARYPNGQLILTEFDDAVLKQIASITSALYFNATNTGELKKVYEQINELEKTKIETERRYKTIEIFPYLIAIILVMILIKEFVVIRSLFGVKT